VRDLVTLVVLLEGWVRTTGPRRTAGKTATGRIVLGDERIGVVLADALAAREEVDRYTHGFHTWPAGLHPDAARMLIDAFPGRSVGDPFMGGGTILVEAMAAGRRAFGRDLSRVALRIARARTSTASEEVLTKMRSASRKLAADAPLAKDLPPDEIHRTLQAWYEPHVLMELEHLRRGVVAAEGPARPLLEAVFSSILVKASFRKSDTSAKREPYHRPPGTTAVLFHKKARELGRRIAALREAVPPNTPEADVARGDARKWSSPSSLDLVLTSPPYPSTYDYLPLQHLRRVWFGEHEEDDAEIGPRRDWREGSHGAVAKWRKDTEAWTAAVAKSLAKGGHLVVVIGDGLTPAGAIDTSDPTEKAGIAAGLVSVARASVERADPGRDTARWEHIFVFRKGAK
jgi:hypothetical protein